MNRAANMKFADGCGGADDASDGRGHSFVGECSSGNRCGERGSVVYGSTDRTNDYGLAVPALEGTKQTFGRYPRQLSADGGYTDLPSAAACFALGVPFMVPPRPARNPKTRMGRLDAAMLSVEKMWRQEWEKSGASTKRVRMRVERVTA